MKRLVTGSCCPENVFELVDPTSFLEVEFEAEVVKALCCLLPEYWCGVFAGSFVLEGERRVADLALIHRSLSHWFVVEVELAGHSWDHHVLPQLRCFRYGDAETSCISSLRRAFPALSKEKAEYILNFVPRFVAVVANMHEPSWLEGLRALEVQHLIVSIYRNTEGRIAHEIQGKLTARKEDLGFALYSAQDRCLRMPDRGALKPGVISVKDQYGSTAEWTVRLADGKLWISKVEGAALIGNGTYVQIIRSWTGEISLHIPA